MYGLAFIFWLTASVLVFFSAVFESHYSGAIILIAFSSGFALTVDSVKGYGARYFVASSALQVLGILFVYLFWVIPLGFEYFNVNQGFDPARFDYLARNPGEWSYPELGLPGLVVSLIHALYSIFGANIFLNGIALNILVSLIVLCADSDQGFAVAVPLSIIIFPDLLLLFNLPAKEGYAILAILSWYVFTYKSHKIGMLGKLTLVSVFVLCCIPRPHIVGVLLVAWLSCLLTRDQVGKITPTFILIIIFSSFFYFLQGDRLGEISEYSAITRAGENTASLDETKGAVRNVLATDPSGLLHFALMPVRFLAYLIGPFPTGGLAQVSEYNFSIGPDGYAPIFAILNRVTFCIVAALLISLLLNRARIKNDSRILVSIFISGLVFASLYSPFLHLRYRIPFLPMLYLTARMSGIRFGSKIIWVALISELISAVLYFSAN